MREAEEVNVEYYVEDNGRSPYLEWMAVLDTRAKRSVDNAVRKRSRGIVGNSKSVGGGVHELKAGGFRVY